MEETKSQRREREAHEAFAVSARAPGLAAVAIQQAIIRVLLAKAALTAEEVAAIFQYAADQCPDNPQKLELSRRTARASRQIILETGCAILDEASGPKH